jgi:hypothetical protein
LAVVVAVADMMQDTQDILDHRDIVLTEPYQ